MNCKRCGNECEEINGYRKWCCSCYSKSIHKSMFNHKWSKKNYCKTCNIRLEELISIDEGLFDDYHKLYHSLYETEMSRLDLILEQYIDSITAIERIVKEIYNMDDIVNRIAERMGRKYTSVYGKSIEKYIEESFKSICKVCEFKICKSKFGIE